MICYLVLLLHPLLLRHYKLLLFLWGTTWAGVQAPKEPECAVARGSGEADVRHTLRLAPNRTWGLVF